MASSGASCLVDSERSSKKTVKTMKTMTVTIHLKVLKEVHALGDSPGYHIVSYSSAAGE